MGAVLVLVTGVSLVAIGSSQQPTEYTLQSAYAGVCEWGDDNMRFSPFSTLPAAQTRWEASQKTLHDVLIGMDMRLNSFPVVRRNVKLEGNRGGTNPATYKVALGDKGKLAAAGLTLITSPGGYFMRSDVYASVENQVCGLEITIVDPTGRLASIAADQRIQGHGPIEKADLSALGASFRVSLTEWSAK